MSRGPSTSRLTPARIAVRLAALGLLAIAACGGGSLGGCGGSSCAGCGDGTYTYPSDDPARPDAVLQQEAARVRITQAFIDFIKPRLPDLLVGALGGAGGFTVDQNRVLHIPIPNVDLFDIGVAEARIRDGEALIWLDDIDQRMDLRFEPPNSVIFELTNLRLGLAMDLREDVAGTTSSCPIIGTLGMGPVRHAAEISIRTKIDPGVGPDPDRNFDVAIQVEDIALNGLDIDLAPNYCDEPECRDCAISVAGNCLDPGGRCAECHVFCGGLTNALLDVVTALIDVVRPLLNRLLRPVVQNFVRSALGDLNNTPAKLETQLSVGDFIDIAALKAAQPFGLFVAPEPGKFPIIDRGTGDGMEITATGGAEAELADCVGPVADFNMPKGPVPVLGGTDRRGRPYHVGMTFASTLANQMLYAIYRSGTMCLKLTSADVKSLTGGAFSLNASVLSLLASDLSLLAEDAAPVIIQLKPTAPPILDLGSGQVIGQDAMGNDVYDWLLKLNVEDLGIAFHTLVQDRYVRIFEVTTDINVGLNIMVLPDNSLEVAVGELRIDDFEEVFNEILPNADFAMVLPTLIDLALQALLQNQLTFNLDLSTAVSDALGGAPIFMRVNEIVRDGIQEDYLTLTMTFTSSRTGNLSLAAETYARLAEDSALHERLDDRVRPTGRIRLALGELLDYSTQRALEYQVRVDRGLWLVPRAAQPDGTLMVEDAKLLMPGRHTVEVRARFQDDYETLDPTPARLEVLVDPTPPSVSAVVREDAVHIVVRDAESPAERLVVRGRLDGGAPFDIALARSADGEARATLALAALGAALELELIAVDSVGNLSDATRVRVGSSNANITAAPAACACHDVGGLPHGHGHDLLLFALIAGLLALRLRRAR
jgi:hypothetical protein